MKVWSTLRIFSLGLALSAFPLREVSAHALHMSFTEVVFSQKTNTLELSIRVFANDFAAAAARRARTRLGRDSLIDQPSALAYFAANLRLAGVQGTLIPLVPCGVARVNDMLRFCFRARIATPPATIRIANTVMAELFKDQVNVVQSVAGNRRATRLFVRGDGWKLLP